jgi:hypothetical protein
LLVLKGKIEANKQQFDVANSMRDAQNEKFITTTNDFTEAIRTIDDLLE